LIVGKSNDSNKFLPIIFILLLISVLIYGFYWYQQKEIAIEAQRVAAEQEKLRELERVETERQRRIEAERLQQIEAERERQMEAERQQKIEAEAIDMREAQNIADEQEHISQQQQQQQQQLINGRYQLQANGVEVKDTKTGLVWQRCSVGQAWNGRTCSGEAKTFNFDQAQALTTRGWRVPSKDELSSLIVKSGIPTIDAEAFPATLPSAFWTSTLTAGYASLAWDVYFLNGSVGGSNRSYGYHVRLVR
jgi:hypothetical protein